MLLPGGGDHDRGEDHDGGEDHDRDDEYDHARDDDAISLIFQKCCVRKH